MSVRSFLLDGRSRKGNLCYDKMLGWLQNPRRLRHNDPDQLIRDSGIRPGQTVLEIGCGSGFFTEAASRMLGSCGKLYSTDIQPLAVAETQKKADALGLENVIVTRDDAMHSRFGDSLFDLVLLYGVVPAPVISIKTISREINRVLKPGGVCAIWSMAPCWSPRKALKSASFTRIEKHNGVFRLYKD